MKIMNKLSDEEAAWLAGYIDGEGYIGLRFYAGYLHPIISIRCVSESMLEEIKGMLDCGHIATTSQNFNTGNSKILFSFDISKINDVKEVLEQIFPCLRLKQEQADILLEYCNEHICGTATEKEKALYCELRSRNRRGRTVWECNDKCPFYYSGCRWKEGEKHVN